MTGMTRHERRMLAWLQSRPSIAAYHGRPEAYVRAVRRWGARKPNKVLDLMRSAPPLPHGALMVGGR